MSRRPISLLLVFALLFSASFISASAAPATEVQEGAPPKEQRTAIRDCYVGDQCLEVPKDMGYFYVDENYRTQVPLRAISEAMGLTVTWVGEEQKAVIDGGLKGQIVFSVGSPSYTVGGETLTMDTTPVVWAPGRLHVPVRFLVEAAGGSVFLYRPWSDEPCYLYLYFPKGNATPTPPSWAVDDYVTFTDTTVYQPENWAKILDFRARVEAGENVYFEVRDFCQSKKLGRGVDDGIYYECQLLHAELGRRGYRGEKGNSRYPSLGVSTREGAARTQEQELSMFRWELRRCAAVETAPLNGEDWHGLRVGSDPVYPDRPQGDEAWVAKLDRRALLAEPWFDGVRNDPIHLYSVADWTPDTDVGFNDSPKFLDALGDAVYYDNRQMARDCGPYQSGDTVMFDLAQLVRSLWWEYDEQTVPSGAPWGGEHTTGEVYLNYYSDDWQRGADGALVISDKGNPMWKPGEIIHTIKLRVGSPIAVVDGVEVDLGHPVEQRGWGKNQAFCVPKSFLTDVLREQVVYDEARHAWFIGRDVDLGDTNLKDWARGMNAMVCMVDGGGDEVKFDPQLLGMFPRGFWDSYSRNMIPGRVYAAYYLYHGWNAMDTQSVKTTANALNAAATNPGNPCPAWDAFRVGQVVAWGFTAGYISLDETMELLYPAAKVIHDSYDSWDSACRDYLQGYLAFTGGADSELYQLRAAAWESAKAAGLYDDTLFQTDVIPYSGK